MIEDDARSSPAINVGNPERWLSVIGGSALAAYGLKRRSIPGLVLSAVGGVLVWRGAVGHCPLYAVLGLSTAREEAREGVSVAYGRGIGVEQSIIVEARPEQLYQFWRNLENLPRFMSHLQSVEVIDERRSHWVARGPAGIGAEWDAEIINEIPNELIGWRSTEGSGVDNAGSVHFTPAGDGRATEVRVMLRYDPPAGRLGAALARLFGEDPSRQVADDLARLRDIIAS